MSRRRVSWIRIRSQNYVASLETTGILAMLRGRWIEDASWVNRLP
jgi:hypothetical protein